MLQLHEMNITDKRVLIREDLNVPVKDGKVVSDARIRAAVPTIQYALEKRAAVLVMSHFGRPQEGQYQEEYSLAPVAEVLQTLLGVPVMLKKNWLEGVDIQPGQVVLCENVRFEKGEKANDDDLAKQIARLCDVFVMDAFGTAHRAQASTHGVAKFAAIACAGPLLAREVNALNEALYEPKRPLVAIVGGAKVSTKLTLLKNLLDIVDVLVVGGGIANTLMAAKGLPIGKSLYEPELIDEAKAILEYAEKKHVQIPLPTDVIVGDKFAEDANACHKLVEDVSDDDAIYDIGPDTASQLAKVMQDAGTIVWNGPVGVFELSPFSEGTSTLANAIAGSRAFSIAGGGDTIAAISKFNVENEISYISTGGGAFLEFLEGKTLPAIGILNERANS